MIAFLQLQHPDSPPFLKTIVLSSYVGKGVLVKSQPPVLGWVCCMSKYSFWQRNDVGFALASYTVYLPHILA